MISGQRQISYKQDNLRRNKLYGIPEPNAKVVTENLVSNFKIVEPEFADKDLFNFLKFIIRQLAD